MDAATVDYSESISYSNAVLRRKEIQVDASDNQRAAAARPGGTEGENERASARAAQRQLHFGSRDSDGESGDGVSECVGK